MANALGGGGRSDSAFERQLRDINEALVVSSIHQQELAEQAQRTGAALRQSEAELRSHAEELARFNRIAVGRESRMIELKQELNELARRHGEPAPYTLAFDHQGGGIADLAGQYPLGSGCEAGDSGAPRDDSLVSLESVLHTEELARRPRRPPDYETESRVLAYLVQSLAESAATILRVLVEKILEVVKADSAGISLLAQDEKRFRWAAIAGVWQPHVGGGMPPGFGPCADALERKTPLLFQRFERRYAYLRSINPPVEEGLLVPFYVEGHAVGALWALSHGEHRFDAEDLRLLESLGRFASAAYLEQSRRTAALNLMEDAVLARRAIEEIIADLRASEERYRTLFASIDEGFCVVQMLFDRDGAPVDYRFLEMNPGFEKQTGLHGATGERIRELSPDHAAHWFETFGKVALTGEPIRFVNVAHDLGDRWFDVYAFRLGESASRRVAILFTDISERIRLQETTREYAGSLADLNRRKDEFLAMLSHELRNPLSSILNASELLRLQGNRNPVQVAAQRMIDRQVVQLARLVDDLLEVSRISTGRIRLRMERVDFRGVVQRAIETVQPQASGKEQSIGLSLSADPLWVNGDSVRLEQVVVNLLNNAVKYTDRGGNIGVTLQSEEDEAVLRVRDNGIGIAPEMLPHIFELFTQADRSLDRAQGGLGIGLALVQSLVTLHRGRVEVRSTLREGSEFIVRLPVLLSPQVAVAEPARDAPAAVRARKVLVVDDNSDAAQSTTMLLELLGHDARSAHDGASAIKAALDYLPDVVLLDIGLPMLNGLQVAKRIRQEPALEHVVLVALTGYGQESDRQRAREAGFDHYLVKPVDFAKIESILSALAP